MGNSHLRGHVHFESDRIFTIKMGLSLSLIDQGLINLNVTLRGYSKKFWGLFGEVAHITQHNFLIGQFAKMDGSHWSRSTL